MDVTIKLMALRYVPYSCKYLYRLLRVGVFFGVAFPASGVGIFFA